MAPTYKICSPHVVPAADAASAAREQAATSERLDNVRVRPLRSPVAGPMSTAPDHAPQLVASHMVARAAVEKLKLWDNGRTVRVKFLDGIPEVMSKVEAIGKEWEALTNLTLKFVTSGAAEVRITFKEQGFSWSVVGTDALTEPASRATMNYGWLEPTTSLREYQRVVRHEFGHALGMIHEHQNPAAAGVIPWDKPKVYAYYAQQSWNKDDVDFNIFQMYSEDSTNHTSFDPTSIMEYAIPDSLTVGSYSIGWNTEFSAMDRQFMAQQYPRRSPGTVVLSVGGPRQEADLAVGAEVDAYRFEVAATGTYIMTTQGPTDTVLTLHGPEPTGAIVTWDDDRGKGRNARIVRKLLPGTYGLTVRHKEPGGVGTYTIGVTKKK